MVAQQADDTAELNPAELLRAHDTIRRRVNFFTRQLAGQNSLTDYRADQHIAALNAAKTALNTVILMIADLPEAG